MATNYAGPSVFLNQFLSRPATSIPKGSQWAVDFHDLKSLTRGIETASALQRTRWKTALAAAPLLNQALQNNYGCFFCTAIDTPGDGTSTNSEGIKNTGSLRTIIGAGRNDLAAMRMSFVDTNISFTDTFLRGWALATSCFGMVARDSQGDRNYRTDMTCYKFVTTPDGAKISQRIVFYGICCISVNNEEYNYDPQTAFKRREANFVYHDYSIDAETDNPLISEQTKPRSFPFTERKLADARMFGPQQNRNVPFNPLIPGGSTGGGNAIG